MGLFDKIKESDEKRQGRLNRVLENNNIFEGVSFKVVFPSTELRIAANDGATKGIATLAFGLVGLAATSGIKQKETNRTLITIFQIVDKGIVFKRAKKDGKDLRIPFENILSADDTPTKNDPRNIINTSVLTLSPSWKIIIISSLVNSFET